MSMSELGKFRRGSEIYKSNNAVQNDIEGGADSIQKRHKNGACETQKKTRRFQQKTDDLTFDLAMLERVLREGYTVSHNFISPGTATGVLILDHDDAAWVKIFLKEN
jgi:hypothetical protein